MRQGLGVFMVGVLLMLGAPSAVACRTVANLELDDIKYADVVVIGSAVDYHLVLDEAARARRKAVLEHDSSRPEYRQLLAGQRKFLSDYARFDLVVNTVLLGQPPARIPVTWNNSTFGEPETIPEGPYLIALRKPGSSSPPLRGPSATLLPLADSNSLTVLQAPCAPPFMFQAGSRQADAVSKMLGAGGQ